MISGLVQNGIGEEGLKLFNQMRMEGFEPYDSAFARKITSCAVLGALEHGRQLHAQLVQLGHDTSLSTGNSVITMYVRCGIVEATNYVPYNAFSRLSTLECHDCSFRATWTWSASNSTF